MAWAACWTLLRSRPSRQLGEQGSWGGSCPMSTGLPVCLLSIWFPLPPLPVFLSTSPSFTWPCFVCLRQEALSPPLWG